MTVNYTPLLGLAQPVTGTESGTWGDTINASLTALVESSIAGVATASVASGNWTLSTTGSGAANEQRMAILIPTGSPGVSRNIIAPSQSKIYIVINQSNASVVLKGAATTGVTIASGKTTMVAWNGSDFVEITPTTASNLAGGGAGQIPYQSASGTTAMLAAGTSGQVLTSAGAAPPTWSTPAAATKTISNKTGAYTVVAGDLGSIINCTSGTFTVSLTAAASLGSGFTCTIWNTGTGAITIDPNAAETIDGVATLILQQGEGLAVVCNGTNWETDDKKPMRAYSEKYNATYTRPSATGDAATAIGFNAAASGAFSYAIGYNSVSGGSNSVAFGRGATATSDYSTASGSNSSGQGSQAVTGAGAMALGGSYASGTDSFAAAIANNTSSYGATVNNGIAIGNTCKSSGQYGVSLGYFNISSGAASFTVGLGNTASGSYSVAFGRYSTATQSGKYAFGSAQNDLWAQGGKIVLSAATTTTTAVVLTSDGSAASTTNQLIVASGQAMAIQGTLIAKRSGSGNIAAYNITGAVSNNGGIIAATGLALTLIGTDSIGLDAAPTITTDGTNKGITITSGYKSATNIRWVATLNTSEVTYA